MNLQAWINARVEQGMRMRRELLEQLAAAYLLKTDLPPDDVVLVEEQRGKLLTWRFERREAPEVLR